jgi:hypothetical protein
MLKDSHDDVRIQVVKCMHRSNNLAILPLLPQLAQDISSEMRFTAAEALRSLESGESDPKRTLAIPAAIPARSRQRQWHRQRP